MDWMLMPLRRYADFSGRSRRKEYWMFALAQTLFLVVIALIAGLGQVFSADADPNPLGWLAIIIIVVYAFAVIVPSIAVQVRRFHDQDKSGWFILLAFIPYIGSLIVLVFMCIEGTRGENRFGADPKENESLAARV